MGVGWGTRQLRLQYQNDSDSVLTHTKVIERIEYIEKNQKQNINEDFQLTLFGLAMKMNISIMDWKATF